MGRRRSVARELASLLDASTRPVYALDDRRRIVFCNPACSDWLGVAADELIGRRCDYQASSPHDVDVTAALCPPPEAFAGTTVEAELVCPLAAGGLSRRRAHFLPLLREDGDAAVLAVVAAEDQAEQDRERPLEPLDSAALHGRLAELYHQVRAPYQLQRLVGESPAIRHVRDQVQLAIGGPARVAVVGPAGSGCEQVARAIHGGGDPQAAAPLMPLTCSLLDPDLLQTTVTAFLRRVGQQPPQSPGTLLLLDVDELSLDSQLELLALLRLPQFALRTIVTARQSLLELAGGDAFQSELALALSTLVIELPPLSRRRQDIPYLAQQFLEEFNGAGGKQLAGFTVEALDRLCGLPWPGDVDELAAIVNEACQAAEGSSVRPGDLPRRVDLLASAAAHPPPAGDETIKLDEFLSEVESELIGRAMQRARGNKARAARLLGINRQRLLRRLSQLGLDGKDT